MSANLVNLNVNPCKMCMPMGAVSAFCGIKNCMSILHGSQGCATYIRRHMATHYNEPIDIASSSLTEEGTVFGGRDNLIKGLGNLIELYHPEVIGICTTCLAETIGEDVAAIVKEFYAENPETNVKIVNVASPGYGGTQNEGWFAALRALVEQAPSCSSPSGIVNVITPLISPADTRWLKSFLDTMGFKGKYILLPDISDNLDGAASMKYNRLKTRGTDISDIGEMAASAMTLEFSEYTDGANSPAEYLCAAYGVPYKKLPLPVGVRAMDMLIKTLRELGGAAPDEIINERGRYLDAMVDSHKHCGEAHVAIYGEPDFVTAMVRLCAENGILPVLAATGSMSLKLKENLASELDGCREFMDDEETDFVDDTDFAYIERVCRERGVNLMIGSSDGRRIARKLGIPLIRCAFPIHDYVGGQRVRVLGFEGSLNILDQAANAMMDKKESTFRAQLYNKYFIDKEPPREGSATSGGESHAKTAAHPCFGEHACKNARVHLPVAPKCNIQCNYCRRNFDCMNESRPGVSSKILSPAQALERYKALKENVPNLTVAGIAGPGDALANFEETYETLRLIREYDPDVTFCIATNGLLLPQYVSQLKELGVSHVTVTINAVDVKIGAKIYDHIDYMGARHTGQAGAAILLANQLAGVKMLVDAGIVCKVNCVTLKGVNDGHIYDITKKASELGAFMTNIMAHIPVEGTAFEALGRMTNKEIKALRARCGVNIKQMERCRQCRSDAAGTLDGDLSVHFDEAMETLKAGRPALSTADGALGDADAPAQTGKTALKRFAVASKDGTIVDRHFGHAEEFYIYESDGVLAKFLETRSVNKYCAGKECDDDKDAKWEAVLGALSDCSGVICMRIGIGPERLLKENSIDVITTYERIETAVKEAAKL